MKKQGSSRGGERDFGKKRSVQGNAFSGKRDGRGVAKPARRFSEGKPAGEDRERKDRGGKRFAPDSQVRFGNRKSVFLSPEKRRAMEAEAREAAAQTAQERTHRHDTYQGRYQDRTRSAANLSKVRLERTARRGEGGDFPRSGNRFSAARANTAKKESEQGMRLNKFIAHSGVCSRRDADMYIASGSVQVNGQVITEMGYRVLPSDQVRFDGVELKAEKKVYVLLNKPKNYITTTDDPEDRRTVMELVKNAAKERIYPVGRLDRTTMGLLLFTNDGELAKGIMHPSGNIKKTYHVVLDKTLTANDMGAIRAGIELEDGPVAVDGISYIPDAPHKEVGIEIHTGRNRIVRRIFEHLGYQVVRLDRVQLGPLTKKNLSRGQWRHLTAQEVSMFKMLAGGKKSARAEAADDFALE